MAKQLVAKLKEGSVNMKDYTSLSEKNVSARNEKNLLREVPLDKYAKGGAVKSATKGKPGRGAGVAQRGFDTRIV